MLTFTHSIGPDVRIRFSAKPDERIRGMLKANGFRWSAQSGQWWRSRVAGAADFLAALDRAINPRRPDGACWRCAAAGGFFRPQGAATPVYCDACHRALSAPSSAAPLKGDGLATVKQETIKRPQDACDCDWCGLPLKVGDTVFVDLDHGTAYCSPACADLDHFDQGYGPACPGVSWW